MTENENERGITVRPAPLAQRTRPRGLWGQITTVLLRPAAFFRTLLPPSETRQWLWAALIILALVGIAAVRYSALSGDGGAATDPGTIPGGDFGGFEGGDFGGPVIRGGDDFGGDFGGIPPGVVPDEGTGGAVANSTLTQDLTTALLAGANFVVGWVLLTVILIVVPMLRGRAPMIGQNFQIAVWSSLPLAVLAIFQLLYWSGGGQIGQPGIQGLLADWPQFETFDPLTKALAISFTSRLTVFWLWSMILVYFGTRYTLKGWPVVALLIVLVWAGVQVAAPVLTGAITAETPIEPIVTEPEFPGGDFPGGEFPGGEFPGGEFPDDLSRPPVEGEFPSEEVQPPVERESPGGAPGDVEVTLESEAAVEQTEGEIDTQAEPTSVPRPRP